MATVDDIIAQALEIANEQSGNVTSSVETAQGIAGGGLIGSIPTVFISEPSTPDASPQQVSVKIPEEIGPNVIYNHFNEVLAQLETVAVGAIAEFLAETFPFPTLEGVIEDLIANPRAKVDSTVNEYWNQARNNIMSDALSKQNAALAQSAGRGFPMPTGALNATLTEINIVAMHKLAESGHQAAIKNAELAIDVLKAALDAAMRLRTAAMQAAVDYLRARMAPAEIASKFVLNLGNYQAQLIEAAAAFYRALLAKDELIIQAQSKGAELNLGYNKVMIDAMLVDTQARAKAAVAAADAAAHTAAGALSSLNAIASTSKTE